MPRPSLEALEVGYYPEEVCWIFPERDDRGRIVGLVRRFPDSCKMAMAGSMRGLTLPRYRELLPRGPVYLPEGASDTAALHSVGLLAFGRPSAAGTPASRHWLVSLLHKLSDREIVVVGDRDVSRAGEQAAMTLAAFLQSVLARPVAWALPAKGYKDVREQVAAGAWGRGLRIKEVNE